MAVSYTHLDVYKRQLYEHPALCAEMGAAGAKRAQDFSVARYYDEFVRIVSEIAQNGGTP